MVVNLIIWGSLIRDVLKPLWSVPRILFSAGADQG